MIIDGKKIAEEIIIQLKKERSLYSDKLILGAVIVGENKATESFIKQKEKIANELDIEFRKYILPSTIKKRELRKFLKNLIKQKYPQGVILQLPLPSHLSEKYFVDALTNKDIECLSAKNLGKFYLGKSKILPPAVICLDLILKKINFSLENKLAVVVGYGNLVGQPIAHFLRINKANVLTLYRLNSDSKKFLSEADIIITGVGKANIIDDCRQGAVIIDFGYNFVDGKIIGDVNVEAIKNKASFYTPTPGGTGPILVACLFKNFFTFLNQKKFLKSINQKEIE